MSNDHVSPDVVSREPVTKEPLSNESVARQIDDQLTHVWMVRTFLKHSEEAEEDEELQEVYRELYDCMHALGPAADRGDWDGYLKLAKKKLKKLKTATELFVEIQPEISSHTNFQMAARSLTLAVDQVAQLLGRTS